MGRHYIIPIFVPHEGCPHNCVFCNQSSITGNDNNVNAAFVKDTIERYLHTIHREGAVVEVSFFGGTFTAISIDKQTELLEVAYDFKKQGKIDYIRLSTRPDYIDESILRHLRRYDVNIIELGVQSLDEEVLMKSGRGHTENDVIMASKLIKEYGFTLGHQIMLGLPGDSFLKDIETTKKVIAMNPDISRIYPALVLKDTPMERLFKSGIYRPYSLEEAVAVAKVMFGMLTSHGISVIRVGLQTTEEINEGKEIIAGPFHPAFRELVESCLYWDAFKDSVPKAYKGELTLRVAPKDISKWYAGKKKLFNDTKEQLKTLKLQVIQDDTVEKGQFDIEWMDNRLKMSIYEYMIEKYKEGDLDTL